MDDPVVRSTRERKYIVFLLALFALFREEIEEPGHLQRASMCWCCVRPGNNQPKRRRYRELAAPGEGGQTGQRLIEKGYFFYEHCLWTRAACEGSEGCWVIGFAADWDRRRRCMALSLLSILPFFLIAWTQLAKLGSLCQNSSHKQMRHNTEKYTIQIYVKLKLFCRNLTILCQNVTLMPNWYILVSYEYTFRSAATH